MTGHRVFGLSLFLALAAQQLAPATEREAKQPVNSAVAVDLFDAVKSGDIEARFIPRDAASGTVLITNKTEQPLAIRLPEAFAGVPVLAQIGGPGLGINGGNGRNGGNNNGNASNQSIGGGFGGGGYGGVGGGGGVFNVDSGRARKLKVVSVCLDHGKPEPAPRIPYDLLPLASHTSDAKVIELIKMLGRGEIDQQAAQAAAWHLANGLSWHELASKARVKHVGGTAELLFTAAQLDRAQQIAKAASRLAANQPASTSESGE